jgi:2-methylisocitrate lyase-like PEP mutase family enzyme
LSKTFGWHVRACYFRGMTTISSPSDARSPAATVRALLAESRPLVMGGFYDGISARLVNRAGFPITFMGGYAVAASLLGEPDIGILGMEEMAAAAQRLCPHVAAPVLVDADTGYGGVAEAIQTAELYAAAGAAGLFLEDQVWPKRCGHMAGKEVVPAEDWLAKLAAILEVRSRTDLFVVARTDARAPAGLSEALERGKAARDLGVDAVFVEAPQSVAELDAIAEAIPGPKVANMVEFGKTPLLSPEELHARGFDLIVYPVAAVLAQAHAVEKIYATLKAAGTTEGEQGALYNFAAFNDLMGLAEHRRAEAEDSDS